MSLNPLAIHRSVRARRVFIGAGPRCAAAAAAALCALFAGCEGSRTVETAPSQAGTDGGAPDAGSAFTFENTHLHFDLSAHVPHGDSYMLHVAGQHVPLIPHTYESRAHLRAIAPKFAAIPDQALTHYADGIVLPADRVALVRVNHRHPVDGPGLATVAVHIPTASMKKARFAKARAGWPQYASLLAAPAPGADGGAADAGDGFLTGDIMYLTPIEAAKAVLFHHPELMQLDPDKAARTMVHIESAGGLHDLAIAISQQGQAHVHVDGKQDGWVSLAPITLADGTQKLNSSGQPMYTYELTAKTLAAGGAAVKNALKTSKDDPDLRGVTYLVPEGTGAIDASPVSTFKLAAGDSPYRLDTTYVHSQAGLGVEIENLSTATTRKIKAKFRNYFLRHLGMFVQFLDADKNPIEMANPGDDYISDPSYRAEYLGQIAPVLTILSIPVPIETEEYEVEIPPEAMYVRFLAGGLGTSGFSWPKTIKYGAVPTGIFEYAVPCVVLAAGAAVTETVSLAKISNSKDVLKFIFTAARVVFFDIDAAKRISEDDIKGMLLKFGDLLANILYSEALEVLQNWITEMVTEAEMEEAVPYIGWAIKALSITPTIAALTETTAEVLASPATIDNTVATLMSATVTIHPDPQHGKFPAVATWYKVRASFSHNTTQTIEAKRLPGADVSEPIVLKFDSIPVGGQVQFSAGFYSENRWLAGNGATPWMANFVPVGKDSLAVDITIKETLVPLTADTTYSHKQKLEYVNGKYAWEPAAAPAATFESRSCDNIGSSLCQPFKITYSDPDGTSQLVPHIGYAWQSAGPSQTDCTTGQANTQGYFIQDVVDGQDPVALTVPCSLTTPVQIVYDVVHPDRKYFIDTRNGQFHLRKLDAGAPSWSFSSFDGESYGQFTQPFDAAAIDPGGRHVVGANWTNSKLEILELLDAPVADELAPVARPVAGEGIREGLLRGPKAMAFAPDGTLLVLEDINARIQAFDLGGNPVALFTALSPPYFAPLRSQTTPVTYLDLGVENTGYLYVLYFLNDGSLPGDYRVDIYHPDGTFLASTAGVPAARMTVDLWRNLFTLNWEKLIGANGRVEPSVSEWNPVGAVESLTGRAHGWRRA